VTGIIEALVPEVRGAEGEPRADCARCPMVVAEPAGHAFAADTRCCTYHPVIPNFRAGRALARDDQGAALLRRRLADPDGVAALGIDPPSGFARVYDDDRRRDFGRNRALRCPLYTGGELTCSIWRDRPGECRSWFCKHDRGLAGALAWARLGDALAIAEALVARACAAGATPPVPGAPAAAWEAWFLACAERADRLSAADLPASAELEAARAELEAARAALRRAEGAGTPPVPDLLRPAITTAEPIDGGIRVTGYSPYDAVVAPPALFELLARLGEGRPWRDALDPARGLDQALVVELHRIGALEDPEAPRPATRVRHLPVI
jgi:hypothetical protein